MNLIHALDRLTARVAESVEDKDGRRADVKAVAADVALVREAMTRLEILRGLSPRWTQSFKLTKRESEALRWLVDRTREDA